MSDGKVAKTILDQLGGRRFATMTGAKDFMYSGSTLIFRIPQGRHVTVTLNEMDFYDVAVQRVRLGVVKEIASADGISVENLRKTFTSLTGLYTSLNG